MDDEKLEAHALALNLDFVERVVEAHNLCPFSRPARDKGRVSREAFLPVITDGDSPASIHTWIDAIPDHVEVALLVCPRAVMTAQRWRAFVEQVRTTYHEQRTGPPVWAAAAFHPEMPYRRTNADAAVSLFRRSPDPTIQFVRLATLDAVGAQRAKPVTHLTVADVMAGRLPPAAHAESASERVTRINFDTANQLGFDAIEAQLAELASQAKARISTSSRAGAPAQGQPPATACDPSNGPERQK